MNDSTQSVYPVSAETLAFHRDLLIFDGHSDLLMPVTDGTQRLADPVDRGIITHWQCTGQYSVPAFQTGAVSAQVCAIFIDEPYLPDPLTQAARMTAAFLREVRQNPRTLVQGRTAADITKAKANEQTALILALEGAEPLEHDLSLIKAFYEWGVRFVGLTHSRRNLLADGTQQDIRVGGLTKLGFAAVERMQALGIVVDLAHLAAPGFWDVIALTQKPVVVTHTAPATEAPGYRERFDAKHPTQNVTKLEAIARTGGVVGVLFYSMADLAAVASQIEFVIDHVGDDYVSLGSDFYGRDACPAALSDMSDLPQLTQHLLERGHSRERIAKIMGGNLLRVFAQVCG